MNVERINQAINYETLLLASNDNVELVDKIYNENIVELSYTALMNFSKFAGLLSIKTDRLSNYYFRVSNSFSRLPVGYNIISPVDSEWPSQIEKFPYCPKFLYYMGDIDLLNKTIVSIIGTKAPTDEDKILVNKTVDSFVKNGIIVASGLSLGIEGLASAASCTNFAPTIAVIGTSLERHYPEGHEKMQDFIATEGGLVITMIPPCAPSSTFKFNFLIRNRLLSALSSALVIIDDRDRGGSIKMAEAALENNRKVFFYTSLLKRDDLKWPAILKSMDNVSAVRFPGNLVNILLKKKNIPKKILKDKKEKLDKPVQLPLF
jgi:DNA processing protein